MTNMTTKFPRLPQEESLYKERREETEFKRFEESRAGENCVDEGHSAGVNKARESGRGFFLFLVYPLPPRLTCLSRVIEVL